MDNMTPAPASANGRHGRFIPYHCGRLRGTCLKGYEGLDLATIPWDQIKQGNSPDHQLAKTSRTRRVVRLEYAPPGQPPRGIYVKRVLLRDWRKRIGCLFIHSKSRHEWDAGFRLLSMGLSTPQPVIFAEVRHGPWLVANYLATEEITNAAPLRVEVEQLPSWQAKRGLLGQLAAWLADAHDRGFYHDDCSAQHVFVGPPDTEGRRHFTFIDLDNCRFHRMAISWRKRIKNLFQLLRSIPPHLATRTDRLRFICAYLEAARRPRRLRNTVERLTLLARAKNANIYLLADRRQRAGAKITRRPCRKSGSSR